MRGISLLLLAALAGCSTRTFAEPQVFVSPYMAVYQLRGDTKMESQPGGTGPIVGNRSQTLEDFGSGGHEEDIGIRADVGDGFAGIRLDWYQLDMNTSKFGVIDDDWGALPSGSRVQMSQDMDEFRLSYVEPVYVTKSEWRNRPLEFKVAAGGVFAHRSMHLRATTDDYLTRQDAKITGQDLYPAVRMQAKWRDYRVDLDYAVCPDLHLSGDMNGVLQDLELRLTYEVPLRDLRFFAGYRYGNLDARGTQGNFDYEADLTLDGLQFGLQLTF
jgi:hypothetical protein